ncbi:MAG TPA: hypothetical protein PJ988_05940, partial [Anaerolinea sp.]|nr:hypothetical protein [Anaerolinea sp.]
MAQRTEVFTESRAALLWQQAKPFLLNNGPLLITILVFILGYSIAGLVYPSMQKPQVFFNLFINNASLLIISIGMTFVVLLKGIDLSVASVLALTSVASAVLLRLEAGVSVLAGGTRFARPPAVRAESAWRPTGPPRRCCLRLQACRRDARPGRRKECADPVCARDTGLMAGP